MENKYYFELIKASLTGTSFTHLVELAAVYLNNPLLVIDNSFNIIAYSENLKSTDNIWLDAVTRGYITIEFGATLNNWDVLVGPSRQYFDTDKISSKNRRFIRLKYQHQIVGYLDILEEKTPLDTLQEEQYLFIAALLAKELLFNFHQLDLSDFPVREEEIMLELLQHRFTDRAQFNSRIQGCHLKSNSFYHIGCIDFSHYISYNAHHSQIQANLRAYIPDSTSVFYEKQLIILIKTDSNCNYQMLDQFLHSSSLSMGISDPFKDLYQFTTYLSQAQTALRLRQFVSPDTYVSFYEKCKPYHMFEYFKTEELLQFCHQRVLNLNYYDEQNKTNYIKTLRTYLYFQKSIQQTANHLYVHRNTINYRIQKIKEIMEIDFNHYELDAHMLWSCEIIQFINYRNQISN